MKNQLLLIVVSMFLVNMNAQELTNEEYQKIINTILVKTDSFRLTIHKTFKEHLKENWEENPGSSLRALKRIDSLENLSYRLRNDFSADEKLLEILENQSYETVSSYTNLGLTNEDITHMKKQATEKPKLVNFERANFSEKIVLEGEEDYIADYTFSNFVKSKNNKVMLFIASTTREQQIESNILYIYEFKNGRWINNLAKSIL